VPKRRAHYKNKMATIYYDSDADLEIIRRKKVGAIGWLAGPCPRTEPEGQRRRSPGRPSPASRSRSRAEADGLTVGSVADVARWADVIMVLAPDTQQPKIYEKEIAPGLLQDTRCSPTGSPSTTRR
jgi:ketol-acid reductoisomerase